jgi:Ca2+-binding RTX toxin-like protein
MREGFQAIWLLFSRIVAIPQDDTLYGQQDNDTLYGDTDNFDLLAVGGGNDLIDGGEGDDALYGGWGRDSLFGFTGNDLINGNDGEDHLAGWIGDDSLYGGWGNDSLYGEYDNDYLHGNDGNDHLFGQTGNDTLQGGWGSDSLIGVDTNINNGFGEVDILKGGGFGDEFLDNSSDYYHLGNASSAFYVGQNQYDYASIEGFELYSGGDIVVLKGQPSDYSLDNSSGTSSSLYYQSDLIAVFQNTLLGSDFLSSANVQYV